MSDQATKSILLTPGQADAAQWAIVAVEDLSPQDFEELGYKPEDAPVLSGRRLAFAPGRGGAEAAGDMVYRVGVQLTEIEDDNGLDNRAGRNLAKKIRSAYAGECRFNVWGELEDVGIELKKEAE